jgi:hypothetical protein
MGYGGQFVEVRAAFEWNAENWALRNVDVATGYSPDHPDASRKLLEAQVNIVAALDVMRMREGCRVDTAAYWNQLESSG